MCVPKIYTESLREDKTKVQVTKKGMAYSTDYLILALQRFTWR